MPDLADLFPGYASEWINTSSGRIFARVGGKGPPLLLLHGWMLALTGAWRPRCRSDDLGVEATCRLHT